MRIDDNTGYRVYGIALDGVVRYVGATRKSLEFRFRQHRYCAKNVAVDRPLYRWLHGHLDDAYVVLIQDCVDADEMSAVEQREVEQRDGLFNNMTGGAKGTRHSTETKLKMREAAKTKVRTAEHNAKIGDASRGRVHSAESRAKQSAARRAWWIARKAERADDDQ